MAQDRDRDVEGFAQVVRAMLNDGHLSAREWDVLVLENVPSGLSKEEAEQLVIRECVQEDAVIERLEERKLKELIAMAAPDKVLDSASHTLLKRRIEERYRNTRLHSPQAYADQLFDRLLVENQIRDEAAIRKRIEERLRKKTGEGGSLDIESWRKLYQELLAELGLAGDSDLVAWFHDSRRALEIEIAEPEIPSPVLETEPPSDTARDSEQAPSIEAQGRTSTPRPNLLWWQTVLLILVIAALVFGGLFLAQNLKVL